MATEVIMPALGMAQETGKLLRWMKREGDLVTKGEALMEIETDKVTVEIEAPADGILSGVSAAEGDDVPVGQAIAFVLAEGERLPESKPVVVASAHSSGAAEPSIPGLVTKNGDPLTELGRGRVLASPKARRLASERGLRVEDIVGTGPHGAVQAADVLARATPTAAHAPTSAPTGEDFGVSNAWKTMASRMQHAWHDVPHFFLERDVDATRLNSWREAVRRRAGYEKLTHTDLLIAICAAALADHPRVNASWIDGTVFSSGAINVGVAVATDDALIVPVVHGADGLGLKEIAARRAEIVSRARERKLTPADISNGTFTVSNLGMFGVDSFHAIVNTPQAAILAVGRIADRPVAVEGEVVVRPMMTISLSFDHRVVDGAEGARFLDTLVALIEEPGALVR